MFEPERIKAAITKTTQERLDNVVRCVITQAISVAVVSLAKAHVAGQNLTELNINGSLSLMKMLFDHYNNLTQQPGAFHFAQDGVNYSFRSEIMDYSTRQGKIGQCGVTFLFTTPTGLYASDAELDAVGKYTDCTYACLHESMVDEYTVARILIPLNLVQDIASVDVINTI